MLGHLNSGKRFSLLATVNKWRRFCSSRAQNLGPIKAGLELNISNPTFMIWGSNTGVGKTLVSTGLVASLLASRPGSKVLYLKPIQTGFPHDSDSRFVARKSVEYFKKHKTLQNLFISDCLVHVSAKACRNMPRGVVSQDSEAAAEHGIRSVNIYEGHSVQGKDEEEKHSELTCKTLYAFNEPVSAHLAAAREGFHGDDCMLVEAVRECLRERDGETGGSGFWGFVETAGGVASPGPFGSLQCDLYRPFRLPSILVVDGRLGGISGTISAYESLCLRGYDVSAVILADGGLLNEEYLSKQFKKRLPVFVLPKLPEDPSDNLMEWFSESSKSFYEIVETLQISVDERIQRLREMQKKAGALFWWPFTQHALVPEQAVTVIDSRFGENFAVHKVQNHGGLIKDAIVQQFDGCASWWTQGPDAILQTELAREVGYATGRFGHVMFPVNVYEPTLSCAEVLLESVGKGWASRVFFSDNGSTAIEIALKMAFRKFAFDHALLPGEMNSENICPHFKVLALKGSYHGDTLGAMEAQAPSPFTGFFQHPWYSGRGLFLDPPTVAFKNMEWKLDLPPALSHLNSSVCKLETFSSDPLFNRQDVALTAAYHTYVTEQLSKFSEAFPEIHVAALILEPVIHAAGGMHMVDPLFQRVLVKECRNRRVPVIFDEVFTGFWRLGFESAAMLLGCLPDIACYAKLLTGGIVPLAVTLATEDVFRSFEAESKLFALLHGHSYSGHALGCSAAVKAVKWFRDPDKNTNLLADGNRLRELWDNDLLSEISSKSMIRRVTSLGTVCAFELEINDPNSGYASLSASSLVEKLRQDGIYVRPLGNVVYLMCGPTTSPSTCSRVLEKFLQRLDKL